MVDVEKYFQEHLPYDLGILMAHYQNTRTEWTGDQNILRAMFVGSLIKGRLFLEALGVTYSESQGKLVAKSKRKGDVNAVDLGGNLIDRHTLDKETHDMLSQYLLIANKTEAHLTSEKEHDLSVLHPAIKIIALLVKENIYQNRQFPIKLD